MLARVDGHAFLLDEGVHVVTPVRVTDPGLVTKTLREHGVLDRDTFERAMARDRRRALSRHGSIDEAWLKEEWFEGIVDLVGLIRGAPSAASLREASVRLTSLGAEPRREAEARIEALVSSLESGAAAENTELVPLVALLARAARLPGRARRTRVLDVLRKALAWPDAPAEAVEHLAAPLDERDGSIALFAAAVRKAGKSMVRALPPARDPAVRDKTLAMLAFYGLTFRIGEDGVPLRTPADIDRAIAKQTEAAELAKIDLTMAQALALVELAASKPARRKISAWVAEGLEIELVVQACKEVSADTLSRAPNVRGARAFATWSARLVPHYRSLGITFELSPEMFTHLPRNEDVAVLAVCLMEHATAATGAAKDTPAKADPIAILDATLGMFSKLPAKAAGILERVKGTSPGAGKKAFPELAAWLDEDARLDRFVHLARIAGVRTSCR